MRDLEFLPDWYPLLRRRRRTLVFQAWVTGIVALGLGVWAAWGHRDVHVARSRLASVNLQLAQTDTELQRLNEIEALKRELEQQDDVVRRLGTHVPASRLLAALDEVMPPEMALLDLGLDTEEQAKALTAAQTAKGADPVVERKLKLRMVGVTPTDAELANFMTRLVAVPYFADVAMSYARDRADGAHLMREFEVTFTVGLDNNAPDATASTGG